MKRTIYILLFSFIVIIPILLGMASPMKMTDAKEKKGIIQIETKPNLEIHEGYVSQKKETILVKKGKKTVAKVHLSEPVMVAQAEQEEKWGYYQFPNIGRADDGTLIVTWHMREDSHKAYGTSGRKYTPMMSKDQGQTWKLVEKPYKAQCIGYNVFLKDGSVINVVTPKTKDINSYKYFPKAVAKKGNYSYYPIDSLPDDLQGIYLNYHDAKQKNKKIHARLDDPGALRYAIGDMMPIVWWGNIKQIADHSLIAGVYPAIYQDNIGQIMPSAVSFYQSKDKGATWKILSKIPFYNDGIAELRGDARFDEPAFEVLADSTFICVMRTGSVSPMYKSLSSDKGKTWTRPQPFTPNGVMPRLLLLKNGVLVLVSGRPGVQIRFSYDGSGRKWSEPIDMIPFMNHDGTFRRDVSCGYASIIGSGDNSFHIVYSDFTTMNSEGQIRKSIWFRRVVVNRE